MYTFLTKQLWVHQCNNSSSPIPMLLPQHVSIIRHHQAADSGVLSQAVCSTAIAVSWISNHKFWLPWYSRIVVTVGIKHCGYCGVASCCVCIINKAIMGPSTQQFFFSSSDVIATCFDHTIIIRWETVVYCRKWFA
jgi:hypothetical protein